MVAWIWVRLALRQPVMHPWLGALMVGLLSTLAAAVAVIPGIGPVPNVLGLIGAVGMSMLFSAGVRYEATHQPYNVTTRVVLAAIAVAAGLLLVFAMPDFPERKVAWRLMIGVFLLPSLIWLPSLLKQSSLRLGTIVLSIFVVGVLVDRVVEFLAHNRGVAAPLPPYLESSDVFQILGAGAAIIIFSAERARHERHEHKTLKGASG